MNILVCDDDKEFLDFLSEKLVKKYRNSHEFVFTKSREEFLNSFNNYKKNFDVLIMDICLNDSNGIDLACFAQNKFPLLQTIFITGYGDKVEDIFIKTRPYAYVSKPINFKLLCLHIDRLDSNLTEKNKEFLLIDNKNTTAKIPFKDIILFESQKRKLQIYTIDNTYYIYKKINDLEIITPNFFVRCHQSFLVNLYYVKGGIINNKLELITGQKIPISRSKIIETQKTYFEFRGGKSLE